MLRNQCLLTGTGEYRLSATPIRPCNTNENHPSINSVTDKSTGLSTQPFKEFQLTFDRIFLCLIHILDFSHPFHHHHERSNRLDRPLGPDRGLAGSNLINYGAEGVVR